MRSEVVVKTLLSICACNTLVPHRYILVQALKLVLETVHVKTRKNVQHVVPLCVRQLVHRVDAVVDVVVVVGCHCVSWLSCILI